jgi:hypothetical protein
MALYYTLPIYKASYEMVILLFSNSDNFAREYKYTTGQQMKDQGAELIKNIYRANKAMDKTPAMMQEFNQIGLRKFVEINMCIEVVSKQLVLWEKYSKRNAPPESSDVRAQASVRSKSHNPLAKSEESRPTNGHVTQLHQKNCVTKAEVIIPLAGNRDNGGGGLNNQGVNGNYWSSSPDSTNAYNLNFNSGGVNPANNNDRANGFSVRCLKDLQKNDY